MFINPRVVNRFYLFVSRLAFGVVLSIALAAFSANPTVAQWTTADGQGNINSTNSGNVGVGTTTPGSRLVVKGVDATSANSALNIVDSSSNSILSARNDGRVSVGTSNPFSFFHVKALGNWLTHTTPKGVSTHSGSLFDFTYTDSSTTHASLTSSEAFIDLAANPGAGKSINGFSSLPLVPTSNSAALSNLTLRGIDSSPSFQGTGSIQQLQGIRLVVENTNTGSMVNLQGVVGQVQNLNSAGVVTNVAGVDTWMPTNAGTVTNYYGARINSLGSSGTITNTYGIYVGDISAGTQTTKPFSFYASDPNTDSYFAGNVGIGTTTPTDILAVEKNQNGNTIVQIKNGTAGTFSQAGLRMVNDASKVAQFGIYSSLRTPFGSIAGNDAYAYASTNLTIMANAADAVIKFASGGDSEKMRIDAAGRVGIGTSPAAAYKLDVAGAINATALNVNGTSVVSSQWAPSGSDIAYTTGRVGIGANPAAAYKLDVAGAINATALNVNGTAVVSSQWAPSGSDIAYTTGRVGIGANPAAAYKLDVAGAINATALNVNGTPVVSSQWTSSGNDISYVTGNVSIGTAGSQKNLHVAGNVTVDGTINAKYQDVAEWVPSTHALPAGTVVTLDPTKSNHVEASSIAYDTRVAGVVSPQPGIALGEKSDNKVLVATTGRVKVMVDASAGPIGVGDLLVTSDIAGVAMKSEPMKIGNRSMHMPGTLIGKALEPLAKGRGEILVLLSLQ